MIEDLRIELLANHADCLPVLASWLEKEWAFHYRRDGGASAAADLVAYSNARTLPIGLVAFRDNSLCGMAVLKAEPLPEWPHLTPVVGAGVVHPSLRRQGIGAKLLIAVEDLARDLGFARIYCATATSANLLERGAWQFTDRADRGGEPLAIYEKPLRPTGRCGTKRS